MLRSVWCFSAVFARVGTLLAQRGFRKRRRQCACQSHRPPVTMVQGRLLAVGPIGSAPLSLSCEPTSCRLERLPSPYRASQFVPHSSSGTGVSRHLTIARCFVQIRSQHTYRCPEGTSSHRHTVGLAMIRIQHPTMRGPALVAFRYTYPRRRYVLCRLGRVLGLHDGAPQRRCERFPTNAFP